MPFRKIAVWIIIIILILFLIFSYSAAYFTK